MSPVLGGAFQQGTRHGLNNKTLPWQYAVFRGKLVMILTPVFPNSTTTYRSSTVPLGDLIPNFFSKRR